MIKIINFIFHIPAIILYNISLCVIIFSNKKHYQKFMQSINDCLTDYDLNNIYEEKPRYQKLIQATKEIAMKVFPSTLGYEIQNILLWLLIYLFYK